MSSSFAKRWETLVTSEDLTVFESLIRLFLKGASKVFACVSSLRNWGYEESIFSVRKMKVPIVSIGNLSLGGTGKTQIVIWCAARLKERGLRTVILSRGYGRKNSREDIKIVSDEKGIIAGEDESGDEPALMARQLPGTPIIVGADRAHAAQIAMERFSPQVFLLDDGFQRRSLARDLDVLCLDEKMLDAPRIFPDGFLREPIRSFSRAQFALIKTQNEELYAAKFREIFKFYPTLPSAVFTYRTDNLLDHVTGSMVQISALAKRPVYAFSGIANPRDFERILKDSGADLIALKIFPDHHRFTLAELDRMVTEARERNALMVTTEKDRMRIPKGVPVWSVQVSVRWLRGEDEFLNAVLNKIQ